MRTVKPTGTQKRKKSPLLGSKAQEVGKALLRVKHERYTYLLLNMQAMKARNTDD